jgi:NitT/TauT family transport system ATP-binding protein
MGFHCHDITKVYRSHERSVTALEGVDLSVTDQEFVCIVGPSGCGKTTLLKIIANLVKQTSGEIIFDTTPEHASYRSAMVFQDQGLFPWMTVEENVTFGLEMRNIPKSVRRDMAVEFLQRVGLEKFTQSYPHELSGGMRQRVAIIRAFLTNPDVLLMDEPFGALDAQTRVIMQEELLRLWKEHPKTVIYITHDINEAILLGDRVVIMSGRPGRIKDVLPIPLSRPRTIDDIKNPETTQIYQKIWNLIEADVIEELRGNK